MHASNLALDVLRASDVVRKLIIVVACGLLIVYSGVLTAMFAAEKTNRVFLYPSFALYTVFTAMWLYTAAYLQRMDIRWFESYETFLHVATALVAVASLLWIVGMWPAYGVLTVPIYLVMVTFVSHAAAFIPSTHLKTQ